METNNQELTIKASRISSPKSLFFPMKYHFVVSERTGGKAVTVYTTTYNWIGQRTEHKQTPSHVRIKGFILRRMTFSFDRYGYGKFWFTSCTKAKRFLKSHLSKSDFIEWSDAWF